MINLGLNLAWAPQFGVLGSASASLAAAGLAAVAFLAAGQMHYPVPHAWCRLLGGLAPAVGTSVTMQHWPTGWLSHWAGLGLKAGWFLFSVMVWGEGWWERENCSKTRRHYSLIEELRPRNRCNRWQRYNRLESMQVRLDATPIINGFA